MTTSAMACRLQRWLQACTLGMMTCSLMPELQSRQARLATFRLSTNALCTCRPEAAAQATQAGVVNIGGEQPSSVAHSSIAQGACRLQSGLQAFHAAHCAAAGLQTPQAKLSMPCAVPSRVRSQLASGGRPAAVAAQGPCRVHVGARPLRPNAASPGCSADHSTCQVGSAAAMPGEQGGLPLPARGSPETQ